jgi:hypothetical protein
MNFNFNIKDMPLVVGESIRRVTQMRVIGITREIGD